VQGAATKTHVEATIQVEVAFLAQMATTAA
jgi:hypothetical protein